MKKSTKIYVLKAGKLFFALLLVCLLTFNVEAQDTYPKRTINVPKASIDNPPVMDGILDPSEGWNLNQTMDRRIDITNYDCSHLTPGPESNNIVTWGAQWDENYLYIAVKVLDDKIRANDLYEMFVGMGPKDKTRCPADNGNWPPVYKPTDFQLQMFHDKKKYTSPQDAQSMVDSYTWLDNSDGYIIETALLWEEMQFFLPSPAPAIEPCYKIMFDISSSDADDDGARISTLRWNECCSDRAWMDNTDFGDLILSTDAGTCPLAVNEMKNLLSSVSLIPNPSNGSDVVLNIQSKEAANLNISIMNVMSQTLSNSNRTVEAGSNDVTLNTSDLSNGMYWVSISNGKSSMAKKLVINK